METNPISDKVTASAAAGAFTLLIAYLVRLLWSVELDLLVQGALTTVIMTFVAWFKKDPVRDAGVALLNSRSSVTKDNVEAVANRLLRLDGVDASRRSFKTGGPTSSSITRRDKSREGGFIESSVLVTLACLVVIIAGLIFIVRAL